MPAFPCLNILFLCSRPPWQYLCSGNHQAAWAQVTICWGGVCISTISWRDFCSTLTLVLCCNAFGFSPLLPFSWAGTVRNRGSSQISLITALFCIDNSSIIAPNNSTWEERVLSSRVLYHMCAPTILISSRLQFPKGCGLLPCSKSPCSACLAFDSLSPAYSMSL